MSEGLERSSVSARYVHTLENEQRQEGYCGKGHPRCFPDRAGSPCRGRLAIGRLQRQGSQLAARL
jgi:hypothetical protein